MRGREVGALQEEPHRETGVHKATGRSKPKQSACGFNNGSSLEALTTLRAEEELKKEGFESIRTRWNSSAQ
jgi:hypothetical protein